jgi:hypothetical protein
MGVIARTGSRPAAAGVCKADVLRPLGSAIISGVVNLGFLGGRLLEGERELACVGLDASVTASERCYGIVRTKTRGWHYAVKDRESERHLCSFDGLAIRRGGTLRSGAVELQLRGRPLRPRSWRFTTEAGSRIEVGSRLARSDPFKFALLLRSEDSIAQIPDAPLVLARGCWVIVNWENAPAGFAADPAAGWMGIGSSALLLRPVGCIAT